MCFVFKTPFQDTYRCFQETFFLDLKTPMKFSRHLFKTHFFFQETYLLCLENSQKRLESNLGFLAVSSKFFDYVLKGVLI